MIGDTKDITLPNGRRLRILTIDKFCQTFKGILYWSRRTDFEKIIANTVSEGAEKILVVFIEDKAYIIIVHSTYPNVCTFGYEWKKEKYKEFLKYCESIRVSSWRKEGF